jgi:hypothetical protein
MFNATKEKQMAIFEKQQGMDSKPSSYAYQGYDRESGLHVFEEDGKRELFARTKSGPAGWHLRRGAYCFEFVRSA